MPNELNQSDIDALLRSGEDLGGEEGTLSGNDLDQLINTTMMSMPDFSESPEMVSGSGTSPTLEMLYNVELNVRVELGRTKMAVEDILRLREGSVITFDKDSGAQVDILVNDRLVAHGEVLVLNDLFCVRVTEVLSNKERSILGRE
ncbi:MAG: flagellar motor switch protein FliN [Planctomycetes bacterium]|nr:flagellar motor switch protein FliN [Planctomycetota bacterium]